MLSEERKSFTLKNHNDNVEIFRFWYVGIIKFIHSEELFTFSLPLAPSLSLAVGWRMKRLSFTTNGMRENRKLCYRCQMYVCQGTANSIMVITILGLRTCTKFIFLSLSLFFGRKPTTNSLWLINDSFLNKFMNIHFHLHPLPPIRSSILCVRLRSIAISISMNSYR